MRRATRLPWSSRSPTARWAASQQLAAPPVKQTALAAGLAVTQPEKIRNNAEFRAQLEAIAPDAIVVVAYGRIIPPWMLGSAAPWAASICMHLCCRSTVARRRSSGPWQWARRSQETPPCCWKKGWTRGRFCCSRQIEIGPEQTAADLFDVLANAGAPLVVETLSGLADGASNRSLRTTLLPPLRRFSTAKTGAWTLPRARQPRFRIAGVDFSPGRALSPCSMARS